MDEKKRKVITRLGMALAVIIGSIFGLFFVIIEYLKGEGLQGPMWKILLIAFGSILIAGYLGELIVRSMAKALLSGNHNVLEYALRSFAMLLLGSFAAYVAGWVSGNLIGKISGPMADVEWITILLYTPFIALYYSLPHCLGTSILFGVFVLFYLKKGERIQSV